MAITTHMPKLRRSRQREEIYNYLCQSEDHPSAEMIYSDLRGSIPNLSLGTVYRNLGLLEKLGQIRKIAVLDNVERYDAKTDPHGHFVCAYCGCIHNMAPIDESYIQQCSGLSGGMTVTRTDITFYGCCETCAQHQTEAS